MDKDYMMDKDNMTDKGYKPLRIYKASAGSGKTFRLAVEYISLLALNPMEYQNILAVTFTNKATAEMKQRILGTLYAIANGLPSASDYEENILKCVEQKLQSPCYAGLDLSAISVKDRATLRRRSKEALSNIIHDYSRFHIETIDSFFQSILHEIANELDLSVNMRVELDEDQVLSDAVDTIIDGLKEDSTEYRSIIKFINEKIQKNQSWKVDDTVKEFGKNIFKESYLIHGDDAKAQITDTSKIEAYKKLLEDYRDEKKGPIMSLAAKMLDICDEIEFEKNNGSQKVPKFLRKAKVYDIKEATSSTRGTFSDSIEAYVHDINKWFLSKSKNKDLMQGRIESDLMPMLGELFALHDEYASRLHSTEAAKQHLYSLMLLNKISDTVHEQNNEKSRFLLSETAKFLRDVISNDDIPFIYEKAGSVIKHIMIDEFQDTSTLQWGNFKPLIMNSIATDGSCLIVGDVKQSIYRFRNSDWQILNNIERDPDLQGLIGDIPAIYNFRSSRHVVEFNNTLFSKAASKLEQRCPDLITAYGDVKQEAKHEEEKGFVRVENIDYHHTCGNKTSTADDEEDDAPEPDTPQAEDPLASSQAREGGEEGEEATAGPVVLSPNLEEAMLERLSDNIYELILSGVDANDITILVRRNSEVLTICNYFNSCQEEGAIKVVSDNAFRLDASPAIDIIIKAIRVLASNDDHMHLTCLAYAYAKHVTGEANPLAITMQGEEGIETHLPEGFRLYGRADMRSKSITEQVEDIYHIFSLSHIPGQDAYLFCFHDILERFCSDNQASATLFLEEWEDRLHDTTIPNGAHDGVRIMTMHKSKGLEFHTVIIPSCMWDIKPKDREVMWCVPKVPPYNAMPLLPVSVSKATDASIFAADRHEEELKTLVDNINVLYVAFTRAKHNLIILTGNKPNAAPGSEDISTAQDFVMKSLPDYMEEITFADEDFAQWQYGCIVPSSKAKKAETEADAEAKQHSVQENANVLESAYAPLTVAFTSNQSVAEFRQSYESDLFITADASDLKTQQHQERIRLISLGNLYHNIFQMIHTSEDIPHAISILEAKGCFETLLDANEARHTVEDLVSGIQASHPEWFSSEWRVLNERNILFSQEGEYATKRPDRVVVNGDRAIIIDYKTARGAAKTDGRGKVTVPSENKRQIAEYKHLLDEMGYKETKAYLWYIFDDIVEEVNV